MRHLKKLIHYTMNCVKRILKINMQGKVLLSTMLSCSFCLTLNTKYANTSSSHANISNLMLNGHVNNSKGELAKL